MPPVSQSTHGFSGSSTLLAASAAPGTSLRRSTSTAEASISCPLPTEFPEAPHLLRPSTVHQRLPSLSQLDWPHLIHVDHELHYSVQIVDVPLPLMHCSGILIY